jgi:hypothetical protein
MSTKYFHYICPPTPFPYILPHPHWYQNETCWHYSRNGGREIKENDGGGEFNYDKL